MHNVINLCLTWDTEASPPCRLIRGDCSLEQSKTVESPEGVFQGPLGICFSTICSLLLLNLSHTNCCTALTFNLRIHKRSRKPTADVFGQISLPHD